MNGLTVMMKENKLTTITPKCEERGGKHFIGATGELWPCCWLYSQRRDLEIWAEQNDCDMSDIDLKKHTIQEVIASTLWTEFHKSFDTPLCIKECSDSSDFNHWTKRGHLISVENERGKNE